MEQNEYLKPEKGWDRLIFDMCTQGMEVVLTTENKVMTGKILDMVGGIVIFQEQTDRFRKNVCYVPTGRVTCISAYFE